MKHIIMTFELQRDKAQAIEEVCHNIGAEHRSIKIPDYAQKMGYLAGITGFTRQRMIYRGAAFPTEMLVFSGMDSEMVDIFLEQYRKSGCAPIGLKAILTEHNVQWTPRQLFDELMKEHLFYHSKA